MPDPLLRPACEAAVQVAKVGMAATPPIPAPRSLRPLVRFTRLSDRAVATVRRVLDDDDEFRAHVCATIELAGLTGELDEASLLFLRRPEGWEEALADHAEAAAASGAEAATARSDAAAAKRLSAAEAALARAEAELWPLREEVAALQGQLGDERRARRKASSDLGRLRKQLEASHAATEADAPPAGGLVEPDPAAADRARAELVATQERAVVAEARAEAAERALLEAKSKGVAAVAERPVHGEEILDGRAPDSQLIDRQAVADAVDAAVSAVSSLAEALTAAAEGLAGRAPTPTTRADPGAGDVGSGSTSSVGSTLRATQRSPVPLPPAIFDDTVEAADHLLRVPDVVVLVDGYNVTLSVRGDLALAEQRRWLLDAAAGASARTGAGFQIVFDGDQDASAPADRSRRLGVQARFTAADVEADDVLLELVEALRPDRPVVIVTDDRRVRHRARRLGANVVGVASMVAALRR